MRVAIETMCAPGDGDSGVAWGDHPERGAWHLRKEKNTGRKSGPRPRSSPCGGLAGLAREKGVGKGGGKVL